MGKKCCVCKSYYNKNVPGISFHRFPANESLRKKWLKACKMLPEDLNQNTYVCSRHFCSNDWDLESRWPNKVLMSGAVPSPSSIYFNANREIPITDSIGHLPTRMETSRTEDPDGNTSCATRAASPENLVSSLEVPVNRQEAAVTKTVTVIGTLPRYVGDITVDHLSTPALRKRCLDMVKEKIDCKNKKIKTLRVQKERAKKKIQNFQNLLEHLNESQMVSDHAAKELMDQLIQISIALSP